MCKHSSVIQLDTDRWVCEDCGADAADFIHSSKLDTMTKYSEQQSATIERGDKEIESLESRLGSALEQIALDGDKIKALESRLESCRNALADLAFSDDVTLEVLRSKAKRIYEGTAVEKPVPNVAEGFRALAEAGTPFPFCDGCATWHAPDKHTRDYSRESE